jgi:hypothetical protein
VGEGKNHQQLKWRRSSRAQTSAAQGLGAAHAGRAATKILMVVSFVKGTIIIVAFFCAVPALYRPSRVQVLLRGWLSVLFSQCASLIGRITPLQRHGCCDRTTLSHSFLVAKSNTKRDSTAEQAVRSEYSGEKAELSARSLVNTHTVPAAASVTLVVR